MIATESNTSIKTIGLFNFSGSLLLTIGTMIKIAKPIIFKLIQSGGLLREINRRLAKR